MAEYWVSKKQYWCKYCNIFVRDDAPSRRLHESGLKHQGSKERFIRELYKGGERDKREKAAHAAEIARIEAAASAAHSSRDGGAYTGRPIAQPAPAPVKRSKPTGDKWSNYTTAADLGIETKEESSYEIEQMVRGRTTKVGEWEEVVVPSPGEVEAAQLAEKRKAEEDPEDLREFKLHQKRHADPYDDDDWDPSSLKTLKFKGKEKKGEKEGEVKAEENGASGSGSGGGVEEEGVKVEPPEADGVKAETSTDIVKTEPPGADGVKKEPDENSVKQETDAPPPAVKAEPEPAPAPGPSLFKKRRPPPSSRKK